MKHFLHIIDGYQRPNAVLINLVIGFSCLIEEQMAQINTTVLQIESNLVR